VTCVCLLLAPKFAPCAGVPPSAIAFGDCDPTPTMAAFDAAARASAETGFVSPVPARCEGISGWGRVLERFMAHWDVVALLNYGPQGGAEAAAVQRLALCAAPLVLNQFGVMDQTGCAEGQFYRYGSGHSTLWRERDSSSGVRV
jgi:hypothetical protein